MRFLDDASRTPRPARWWLGSLLVAFGWIWLMSAAWNWSAGYPLEPRFVWLAAGVLIAGLVLRPRR
jgi:hypothetical protein